jgi:DNA-binding CsgD family transcriptional regulator
MNETDQIRMKYFELLSRQQFNEADLDYAKLETHKPMLQYLSEVGKSGVIIFDLFRKAHVFTSYNFNELFGFDFKEQQKVASGYFFSRVHPDDNIRLMQNAILLLSFFYSLPVKERSDFKLIAEYRILNSQEKYIRVIEQNQILELDRNGNVWLALGVIDIAPNQEHDEGIKSQLINFKTGEIILFDTDSAKETNAIGIDLTKREKEVLQLVKAGFLSKEISGKLSISVHTVNTHRQRILEKLGVDNSMEAVDFASRLGLLK